VDPWTCVENIVSAGIRCPNRQPGSELLHRQSYPGPQDMKSQFYYIKVPLSVYRSLNSKGRKYRRPTVSLLCNDYELFRISVHAFAKIFRMSNSEIAFFNRTKTIRTLRWLSY
jgi:hypothetical protein